MTVRPVRAIERGRRRNAAPRVNVDQEIETTIDLGIWLLGIESFLATSGATADGKAGGVDIPAHKDLEVINAALQRCSLLVARTLSQAVAAGDLPIGAHSDLKKLHAVLKDALEISSSVRVARDPHLVSARKIILESLRREPAFHSLSRFAEREGEAFLPEPLRAAAGNSVHPTAELTDLAAILPRFGRILRSLRVIERMLAADEPLKSALVIFARVNEQILDLTLSIQRRLAKCQNEEADIFVTLDAAAYTASIELKKVYSKELAGLAGLRPPTSIYARIETAHSLLNDGFQQLLAGFAKEFDPATDVYEMFPGFREKQERSVKLRGQLLTIIKVVQAAEKTPEKREIDAMKGELRNFVDSTVRFLFYKDIETFERFAEEVFAARQSSDLVPILHRFGAYLETLYGQVSLRFVLNDQTVDAG